MSLDNMITPENADIYKAQWAEQKAIDDYNNMEMVGDPYIKTKGGHGIGSNEWDVHDTVDSIVTGLDTLAAGASFIPGVGSIVSAISGVAATGVQLINDIAKGEDGEPLHVDMTLTRAKFESLVSDSEIAKLATVAEGANKTIVDSALSNTSINPVLFPFCCVCRPSSSLHRCGCMLPFP